MPITLKRVVAYILDVILVGLVTTAISMSPINPNYDEIASLQIEYQEELKEWNEKFLSTDSESADELSKQLKEYVDVSEDYVYKVNKLSTVDNIITIVVAFLYFVVLAYFLNGQTLGKKILSLKVVQEDGEKPTILQLTLRFLVLYGTIFSILNLIATGLFNKETFFIVYAVISMLMYALSIAIVATVLIRKDNRGVHDLIAKTKVEERK